jgi:signal transduction histidine kinase
LEQAGRVQPIARGEREADTPAAVSLCTAGGDGQMMTGAGPELRQPAGDHLTPTAVRELLERQSALIRLTVHELRRPLAVARGHLSMVADGTFGALLQQADPSLHAMASAVQEMSALLDGLAAVARVEDGAAQLRRRRCSIRRIASGCAVSLDAEAEERRVAIEQHGPDVDADVDPDHLRIALVNLLANAVHHSPAGSTVTLSIAADGGALTIAVSDCGPGIAPDEAKQVFEPWYGSHGASEGLGLGLWIVRRIVDWHGGRVTVNSRRGHGATFAIVLPLHEGPAYGGGSAVSPTDRRSQP